MDSTSGFDVVHSIGLLVERQRKREGERVLEVEYKSFVRRVAWIGHLLSKREQWKFNNSNYELNLIFISYSDNLLFKIIIIIGNNSEWDYMKRSTIITQRINVIQAF